MKHARQDYQRIQDPENKIGENEPVMLFRGQDKHFIKILEYYNSLVASEKIKDAVNAHIMFAEEWQELNLVKEPDI